MGRALSLHSDIADLVDEYVTSTKYETRRHGVVYAQRHEVRGAGLYVQLQEAMGEQSSRVESDRIKSSAPESKAPPGWRAEVSDLLEDIDRGSSRHVNVRGGTATGDTVASLRWLHKAIDDDIEASELAQDVHDWRRLCRLTLGYQTVSVGLPGVSCGQRRLIPGGFQEVGCKQPTLRVARDAESAVWCANSECHDDMDWPDCRQLDGSLTCRRSDRDVKHGLTWPAESWALMLTGESA
jgi:hypothetical protein